MHVAHPKLALCLGLFSLVCILIATSSANVVTADTQYHGNESCTTIANPGLVSSGRGVRVEANSAEEVSATHNGVWRCRNITNNTNSDVFVGNTTAEELCSFFEYHPSGISSSLCEKSHTHCTPVAGQCGSGRNQCAAGNANDAAAPDGTYTYNWVCEGTCDGHSPTCSASRNRCIESSCSSWTPSTSLTCSTDTVTQTRTCPSGSACGIEQEEVSGTKTCTCTPTSWTEGSRTCYPPNYTKVAHGSSGTFEDTSGGSRGSVSYSCSSTVLTYTDENCERYVAPVVTHGGWSSWTPSTSLTCSTDTVTQTRRCNNPSPRNGGTECSRENGTTTTASNRTETRTISGTKTCTCTPTSWTEGSRTCYPPNYTKVAHGSSGTFEDTSGGSRGSVSYSCSSTVLTYTDENCERYVAPPTCSCGSWTPARSTACSGNSLTQTRTCTGCPSSTPKSRSTTGTKSASAVGCRCTGGRQTWSTNCSDYVSLKSHGSSFSATNDKSYYTGSATFSCDTGSWSVSDTSCSSTCSCGSWTPARSTACSGNSLTQTRTCTGCPSSTPKSRSTTGTKSASAVGCRCTGGRQTWSTNCSDYVSLKSHGSSFSATNDKSYYTGSATFSCDTRSWSVSDTSCSSTCSCGSWTPARSTACSGNSLTQTRTCTGCPSSTPKSRSTTGTKSASAVGCRCTGGRQTWSTNCSDYVSLKSHGSSFSATNDKSYYTGSATFSCDTGSWSVSDTSCSSTCSCGSWTSWTPATSTECKGVSFTQTRTRSCTGCSSSKSTSQSRSKTGTKTTGACSIIGRCGTTRDRCKSGWSAVQTTQHDTSTHEKWRCQGPASAGRRLTSLCSVVKNPCGPGGSVVTTGSCCKTNECGGHAGQRRCCEPALGGSCTVRWRTDRFGFWGGVGCKDATSTCSKFCRYPGDCERKNVSWRVTSCSGSGKDKYCSTRWCSGSVQRGSNGSIRSVTDTINYSSCGTETGGSATVRCSNGRWSISGGTCSSVTDPGNCAR